METDLSFLTEAYYLFSTCKELQLSQVIIEILWAVLFQKFLGINSNNYYYF